MSFQATTKTVSGGRNVAAGKRDSGDFASGRTTRRRDRRDGGQQADGCGARQRGLSDLDYAKTWFKKFAGFHGVEQFERWRLTQDQVIAFLRNEKSGGAPTWKRLRMVAVDMTAIGNTLRQHAEKSVRSSGASSRASGTVRRLMRRLG